MAHARLDLDVATIALAHVCFEKLIYLDSVTKANRRLLMGVCVLLAHKFTASGKVAHLLEELERTLVGGCPLVAALWCVGANRWHCSVCRASSC